MNCSFLSSDSIDTPKNIYIVRNSLLSKYSLQVHCHSLLTHKQKKIIASVQKDKISYFTSQAVRTMITFRFCNQDNKGVVPH